LAGFTAAGIDCFIAHDFYIYLKSKLQPNHSTMEFEKRHYVHGNEIRQSSDGKRTVAVINSAALDTYGTIIEPEGVSLERYRSNPIFLINHDHNMVAGNGANVRYQDGKLIAEVDDDMWDTDDEEIRKWYNKVKKGHVRMTSIGFGYNGSDVEEDEVDGKKVIRIKRSELYEFSFVSVGSNPDAIIMHREIKAIADYSERLANLEKLIRAMPDNIQASFAQLEELIEQTLKARNVPEPKPEPKPEPTPARSTPDIAAIEAQVDRIIKQKLGKA